MEKELTILVLDRNRHVRLFLKRELERKGYKVLQVVETSELSNLSLKNTKADLIVLDPDLSDKRGIPIIETVLVSFPGVPIILHAFWRDKAYCSCDSSIIACVEKNGNSIERIKKIISEKSRQNDDEQKLPQDTI